MVYLDYSATTPADERVLECFARCSSLFLGNANSLHRLGIESKAAVDKAINDISMLLRLSPDTEVIFTSGASESNNLAIKGVAEKYQRRGKHIITTELEHSSVTAPMNYLSKRGYAIDFVKTKKNGLVDLDDLQRLLTPDTILVSIGSVNSEIGLRQPLSEIAQILKEYPGVIFHSDVTQSIGKENIDLSVLDLASFSAHKFFGLKGVGVLLRKKRVSLEPIIHAGKSTSVYRGGTPPVPLIVSTAMALSIALQDIDEKYEKVLRLNQYARKHLQTIPNLRINSSIDCLPHILNFSFLPFPSAETMQRLSKKDIFVSNFTACTSDKDKSMAVYAYTHDDLLAHTSIRVSLSWLTTEEEIDKLVCALARLGKMV